ncbi:HNH endonuclease family protein [Bombilactobacillus folatiphilus]|uniref:HNH endonuclease family protein n=1 Tax=Bombilactobacillus folatiphilus TaxID=2923362 RepID=A0ABY4P848_9LACO|nr:HNH endonuclease family protein [Bombilactobacillus folatiphilus]UQS81812.1 HNH endonuclease family protein [Bombilactobacillus folatiphilus]
MPQRLNAEWRLQVVNADKVKRQYGGTIGNLTIIKYNQEMGNKTYDEKREYYKDSNVSLTRKVAKTYHHWNKEAIADRTKKLTEELITIFSMPDIKEVVEIDITGEYPIDQTVDVTGKKPVQITISGNEYSVKNWRQMLVTFLNDIWNKDSLNFDRIQENNQISSMLFKSNRNPEKLENGAEIETNFSAAVILAIITKIYEICDIADQVSYTIK